MPSLKLIKNSTMLNVFGIKAVVGVTTVLKNRGCMGTVTIPYILVASIDLLFTSQIYGPGYHIYLCVILCNTSV